MKLYETPRTPNPRRVHIFMAEKGIDIPRVTVNLAALEHKSDSFARITPVQRVPALELDDGTVIAESVAICRYLEELYPDPPLFGVDTKSRAQVEMWNRHVEFYLALPVFAAFRHINPAMAAMEQPQIPEWGEANKVKAVEFMRLLDRELASREFIAGDRFSVADITAICVIDFGKVAKIGVPEELASLNRWRAAVSARPSASAV
ncbi:glutathione S-transferase family protein [Camelimonas abortus]|uniref:Glutathione S-transferase family protein n=1 Tax=Camelimonas abortus TaxID=1017184 RepID=A0ABV7LC01_9HYPH